MTFSYYERMLAVVPRWSIAPRHNHQTVAEHSFYVTLYVSKLTMLMKWDSFGRSLAMDCALRHDMPEAQTGDTPGPIKRQITDRVKLREFEDRFFAIVEPDWSPDIVTPEIKAVIKVADLIDELFWVNIEILMGNRMLSSHLSIVTGRLGLALANIQLPNLLFEVLDECSKMGRGVDLPQNNSDLV